MPNFSVAIFSFNRHQDLLPQAITSVKNHVKGYKEIVVVWDDYLRERDIDFNSIREQTGVNFRVVKHTEIYNDAWPKSIGEFGWVKQQLAKLLCYTYIDSDYTWILDGDCILIDDPELFSSNGIPYLRKGPADYPVPDDSKVFPERYMGIDKFTEHTWVGSSCVFDHQVLRDIFHLVQQRNQKHLVDCVDELLQSKDCPDLPFSEFDIYAHYVLENLNKYPHVIAEMNWGSPLYFNTYPIQCMWNTNTRLLETIPELLDT